MTYMHLGAEAEARPGFGKPDDRANARALRELTPKAVGVGAFRMGARAMRKAAEARINTLCADREGANMARGTTEIIASVAPIIVGVPIPDMPEPKPMRAPDWGWWAGRNEEWFTVGPCSTREIAIEEARVEFDGEGFHIVEAVQGTVTLNAAQLLNAQYFDADDLFSPEDGAEPDRTGGADVIAAADDELQALLDEWVAKWGRTFVAPTLFRGVRNGEFFAATPEIECTECIGTGVGPADPAGDKACEACGGDGVRKEAEK